MTDIVHRVRVEATPQKVYAALSTVEGLSSWWTATTDGASAPGESIVFRFGEHATRVLVDTLNPPSRVVWNVVESNPEWNGTQMTFDLTPDGDATVVRFGHRQWREPTDFYAHCSMKWAVFMLSLKQLVETGEGRPFPRDQAI